MKPEKRVKELEKAIRAHREAVEQYGFMGGSFDRVLWRVLDTKKKGTE